MRDDMQRKKTIFGCLRWTIPYLKPFGALRVFVMIIFDICEYAGYAETSRIFSLFIFIASLSKPEALGLLSAHCLKEINFLIAFYSR
jgi:hypothetical protein